MRNLFLFILTLLLFNKANAQLPLTPFEKSDGKQTATHAEAINFYTDLSRMFLTVRIKEAGPSDANEPLHIVYYNNSADFDIDKWKAAGNLIILINNGIHPGEPDGIDASMMLIRDAAYGKIKIPDNVMLAVIPIFNVGGALNRNNYSRANQNGPEEYGFRGNPQNLDLNRDFIKMDAKETQTLVKLFHELDPDIFIDNHVSDGADYQHVMTLLSTQHNKLGGAMGTYLHDTFEPLIYADMKKRGYDLVPYVNHFGSTPDKGWQAFHEGPRFASGFAALFQTYAFVPETHMLKPFGQRVKATYTLMRSMIKLASQNISEIRYTRLQDRKTLADAGKLVIEWTVDTTQFENVTFKGYEAGYKPSEVSGAPRLYYDHDKPYTKQVPYYNTYAPSKTISIPQAYVIQHGWSRVIKRMKRNGVKMRKIAADTTMQLDVYYITDYQTVSKPYEGHYLHSNVKVKSYKQQVKLLAGDYIISTNQPAKRYIVETLEPTAPDAFFAWGFFDALLQRKEYFSNYVFEDEASGLLKENPALKKELEDKKKSDPVFAKDGAAQLDFIYCNSRYCEPVHMRYPVFRLN